jgi:hypothetical protein
MDLTPEEQSVLNGTYMGPVSAAQIAAIKAKAASTPTPGPTQTPPTTPPTSPQQTAAQQGSIFHDPAYLAYLNAVQGSEAVAQATAGLKYGQVGAALPMQEADINHEGEKSQKSIANRFGAQGSYSSGARGLAQQDAQYNTDRAIANARAGTLASQQNITNDLQTQLQSYKQQAAQQALDSAQRLSSAAPKDDTAGSFGSY